LAEVVAKPGVSQRDILGSIGVSTSSVSRTLAVLSELGDRKTDGLELIKMEINPEDRRERLVHLSPKGRRLMEDLMNDLQRAIPEKAG
jgi:DNA-binding MarR family transcriptional regulator